MTYTYTPTHTTNPDTQCVIDKPLDEDEEGEDEEEEARPHKK